jgi:hypothetical protein
MVEGTYLVKEYQGKILDVLAEIISHGFGEMTVQIWETKGSFKTGITIKAGRSWVYLIDKEVPELKDIL